MTIQDLDIDKEVKAGNIHHNQWLVLKFDFSAVERSPDPLAARNCLCNSINSFIEKYCQTYHRYLGYDTFDELVQKIVNLGNAVKSLQNCVRLTRERLRTANDPRHKNHPLHGVEGVSCALS